MKKVIVAICLLIAVALIMGCTSSEPTDTGPVKIGNTSGTGTGGTSGTSGGTGEFACQISAPYKAYFRTAGYELSGVAWAMGAIGDVTGLDIEDDTVTIFSVLDIAPEEFKEDPDKIKEVINSRLDSNIQASLDSLYEETWLSLDSQGDIYRRTVKIMPNGGFSIMTYGEGVDAISDYISGGKTGMRIFLTLEKAKRTYLSAEEMNAECGGLSGLADCMEKYMVGEKYEYDFSINPGYEGYDIRSDCRYDTESDIGFGFEMQVMEDIPSTVMDDMEFAGAVDNAGGLALDLYWTFKTKEEPYNDAIDDVLATGKPDTVSGISCTRALIDIGADYDYIDYRDYCVSTDECLMAYRGSVDQVSVLNSIGYTEILELSHADFSDSIFDFSIHSEAVCEGGESNRLPGVEEPEDVRDFIPDIDEIYDRYLEHINTIPSATGVVPNDLFEG